MFCQFDRGSTRSRCEMCEQHADVSFCPINMPWDKALFFGRRSFQTQNVTAPAPPAGLFIYVFSSSNVRTHPNRTTSYRMLDERFLFQQPHNSKLGIQHLDSEPHGQRGSVCMKAHCCFVSSHQFAQRDNNIHTCNPLTHRIKR